MATHHHESMSFCAFESPLWEAWDRSEVYFDLLYPEHKGNAPLKKLLKAVSDAEDALMQAEKDVGHAEMRANLAVARLELVLNNQSETTPV